jgi:molybdate transport system substrate-binding protein
MTSPAILCILAIIPKTNPDWRCPMKRPLSLSAGLVLLLFCVGVVTSEAAEIRVLSANPVSEGLKHIAELFKRDTGHDVKVEVPSGAELNRILGSEEPADVLISVPGTVDQALKDGKAAGGKTAVGRVGIGVIVRRGAQVPNVTTPDAIKQAVVAADSVVYNTAGSGQYVHRMLEQLGVTAQIAAKSARPGNGAQTMERMIAGKGNEVGFGLLSEIHPYEAKGVQMIGRLPDSIQNYTLYDGIILARSKSADVAAQFIRYLSTPAAKQAFAQSGVD